MSDTKKVTSLPTFVPPEQPPEFPPETEPKPVAPKPGPRLFPSRKSFPPLRPMTTSGLSQTFPVDDGSSGFEDDQSLPTSSCEGPDPADPVIAGGIIAGLFLTGALGVRAYLRRRGHDLRLPTKDEQDDVGMPLGRLLVRFVPLAVFGPSVLDASEAVAAAVAYGTNGPLILRGAVPAEDLDLPETGEFHD